MFLEEFGIKHIRTSPHHPATNGSCECFNDTLKSMLRAVAEDFPDSCDQTYRGFFSHIEKFLLRHLDFRRLNYCMEGRFQALCLC